jgi:hypothetical protein
VKGQAIWEEKIDTIYLLLNSTMVKTEPVWFITLFLMTTTEADSWINKRIIDGMNRCIWDIFILFFFSHCVSKTWCVLQTYSMSQLLLFVFHVLKSHKWLVAPVVDRRGLDCWHTRLTLSSTQITRWINKENFFFLVCQTLWKAGVTI